MFTDGNNRPSPGLRAFLGRLLYGLLPHRLFQLVGAAWSYLMGPWEASSFLPSGWMIHRSVQSGDLPEVLEVLGLRQGTWKELGECLDELGPWKEFIGPEVGVDLDLLKSWKGVSAGKDVELALNELTAWQKTMIHNNMQVFWEPGCTPWKDMVEVKQEEDDHECHKPASSDQRIDSTSEPCRVALESSSLGIISYILNVGSGGVEWKADGTALDNPSQNQCEIQHIRNKRLTFLQQNKTLESLASDAKQDVPDLPDTTDFSWPNHHVSNLSLNLSECLESQNQPVCAQCKLVSDICLAQGDFLETIQKCSSCEQLPVEKVDKSDHLQQDCPPSPDKDQGYHSLEFWQCPPLQGNLTSEIVETPEPCELIEQSVFGLPTGLDTCPLDNNDGQSSEDIDFDLEQEIPGVPPAPFCTNKHIGYILGTVVSEDEEDDDDNISVSSSDKWDEVEDDDGFDSEGSLSSTDSDADVPEDVLWNSFCSADPYNLQNFTATLQTGVKTEENLLSQETGNEHQSDEESWCDSNTESDNDSDSDYSADEEENLKLWNAFSKSDDPYNPLYFKAPVHTANKKRQTGDTGSTYSDVVCRTLPNHKVTLVTCQAYDLQQLQLKEAHNGCLEDSANHGRKKVTFNDKVTIHYVCNEEERKGHWEELARDRCRFQRRIKETEFVIGHCLTPDHRQRAWERMQRHWDS